jgi:hypothetical protein
MIQQSIEAAIRTMMGDVPAVMSTKYAAAMMSITLTKKKNRSPAKTIDDDRL